MSPPHASPRLLAVVLAGGAVGALLRYAVGALLPVHPGRLPVATLVTNVSGALLLGLLLELLARSGPDTGRRQVLRLGLGTGLLGAFTTYSTLAVEVSLLGRDGPAALGLAYGVGSALLGVLAAAVGVGLATRLRPA